MAEAEGAENIVKTALDEFGKIDGVVSNAGILRDGTFHKMPFENWDPALKVHPYGGYNVIRAAWPHFREQSYGRIVVATDQRPVRQLRQANHSAAKLGLVGLINTLAQEGAKHNIKANALAPIAATRMTEDILPPEVFKKLTPEYVALVVAYLCTEEVPDTASVFIVGGGKVQRAALFQKGRHLRSCSDRRRRGRAVVDDRRPGGGQTGQLPYDRSADLAGAPRGLVRAGEHRRDHPGRAGHRRRPRGSSSRCCWAPCWSYAAIAVWAVVERNPVSRCWRR